MANDGIDARPTQGTDSAPLLTASALSQARSQRRSGANTRRPRSRTAQVEGAIRSYIADEHLHAGDPLPSEGELSQILALSKSTVREGIRRLEALGHVKIVHGVGLRVADFSIGPVVRALPIEHLDTASSLKDILEVRTVIEENFLVRAATLMTPDHLNNLDRIVDAMQENSEKGEVDPGLDAAFHRKLYEPLGNSLVVDLIGTFWQLFDDVRHSYDFSHNIKAVQEHRNVVSALRSHDEQSIREAIRKHFSQIEHELDRFTKQERS